MAGGEPDGERTGAPPAAADDGITGRPVRFGRRLMVMLYESLLLAGVLFGAGLPVVLLLGRSPEPEDPLYLAWLLAVMFGYFGLSWTRGGQTPAMRAWRVRVERSDGGTLGWGDAALRYLGGLLALACALLAARAAARAGLPGAVEALVGLGTFMVGFAWALFDSRGRAWPDLVSGTRLVRAPPRRRRSG